MEGVFRFESWFLNSLDSYTVGLIIGILRYNSTKKAIKSWRGRKTASDLEGCRKTEKYSRSVFTCEEIMDTHAQYMPGLKQNMQTLWRPTIETFE